MLDAELLGQEEDGAMMGSPALVELNSCGCQGTKQPGAADWLGL